MRHFLINFIRPCLDGRRNRKVNKDLPFIRGPNDSFVLMIRELRQAIRPLRGQLRYVFAGVVANDLYPSNFTWPNFLFQDPMIIPLFRPYFLRLFQCRGLSNENMVFCFSFFFRLNRRPIHFNMLSNDISRVFTYASGRGDLFFLIGRFNRLIFQLFRINELVIRARRVLIRARILQNRWACCNRRRGTPCRTFILFM